MNVLDVFEAQERNPCSWSRMIKGTAIRNKVTDVMGWGWNSFLSVLLDAIGRTLGFKLSKVDNHWTIMSRWFLITNVLSGFLWLLCREWIEGY